MSQGTRIARTAAVALTVFLGLLCARPAHAQITLVQSTGLFGTPAGTSTTSSTFTANPTVGNTLIVLVWTWTQNAAATIHVADTAGNIYTANVQATVVQSAWYESAAVFSTPIAATGSGFQITITTPLNDNLSQIRAVALEYSGVGPVDTTAAASGASATATVATPAPTASANELVVSALGIDNPAVQFSSISPSAGYTTRAVELQNAGETAGAAADRIVSSTGVQSITWTTAQSMSGWAAVIATFGPGSGSGSGGGTASGFNAVDGYLSSYPATASGQRIYTKLAGTGFTLNVAALNNAAPTPGLQSPAYVSGPNKVIVDLVGDSDGSCASSCAGSTCQAKAALATLATSFAGADSSFKKGLPFMLANAYPNVRVRVKDASNSPTVYGCSVDNFSVRPNSLTVTSSANADPSGASATATPVVKAGATFTLTATAIAGYSATPSVNGSAVTVNPLSPGIASGSFGAANASNGVASGNFTYSEAGYFTLNTDAVYDQSFTAVDQAGDCTADYSNTPVNGKYGCYFGNAATTAFGRFVPDHFAITAGSVTPACGTFSYFDQDGFVTAFTLTAQNSSNATTLNYTGSFARLVLTSWSGYGFTGDTATPSASATAPTGTWNNGVASVSAQHQVLARPTSAPASPVSLTVSARPVDPDGVTTAAQTAAMSAGTPLRFGVLALGSAYGSNLLALRLPVTAMYWNGTGLVPNTADTCTGAVLSNASIALGNQVQKPGTNGSFSTSVMASPTLASTWSQGRGSITLSAPGTAGTAQVALNLGSGSTDASCIGWGVASTGSRLPWLRGNWCGAAYAVDPSSLASFGAAATPFVYLRENH
ncbi:MAG TPA: DUF6701 domain-containing protein [Mycobacterium sp.]|nr:DUF6701 domain-containing protein [Mycobacterium sp.]